MEKTKRKADGYRERSLEKAREAKRSAYQIKNERDRDQKLKEEREDNYLKQFPKR